MLRGIGTPELFIILALVIFIFGVGRLGRLGAEAGTAIRSFRKSLEDPTEEVEE